MKLKIDEMYAIVAENEEGEGVVGMNLPILPGMEPMFTPFMGADLARIKSLLPHAKTIKVHSGKNLKILKFSKREDITDQFDI